MVLLVVLAGTPAGGGVLRPLPSPQGSGGVPCLDDRPLPLPFAPSRFLLVANNPNASSETAGCVRDVRLAETDVVVRFNSMENLGWFGGRTDVVINREAPDWARNIAAARSMRPRPTCILAMTGCLGSDSGSASSAAASSSAVDSSPAPRSGSGRQGSADSSGGGGGDGSGQSGDDGNGSLPIPNASIPHYEGNTSGWWVPAWDPYWSAPDSVDLSGRDVQNYTADWGAHALTPRGLDELGVDAYLDLVDGPGCSNACGRLLPPKQIPSSGFAAVCYLHTHYPEAELVLLGFDFHADQNQVPTNCTGHEGWCYSNPNKIVWHNFAAEREAVRRVPRLRVC